MLQAPAEHEVRTAAKHLGHLACSVHGTWHVGGLCLIEEKGRDQCFEVVKVSVGVDRQRHNPRGKQ